MTSRESDDIPEVLVSSDKRTVYFKGPFLGKGGYARCYEFTDCGTKSKYAAKVISKTILRKGNLKEKLAMEIAIQKSLKHKHIVGFHECFEDEKYVYIILELCKRRSLLELHRRRIVITESEARYFLHQIAQACEHLHSKQIIHRDLKPGNIFLHENMEVKLGDFGLAAKLKSDDEIKKTFCGTPNFIAPEVLNKTGHSYQVDAWSLGCVLYTLLVGHPPFQTKNIDDTYALIRAGSYQVPADKISRPAQRLIRQLLQLDPLKRLTMSQVLQHEFFTTGFIPSYLPISCLTTTPVFNWVGSHSNPNDDKKLKSSIAKKETLYKQYLHKLANLLNSLQKSEKFGYFRIDGDKAEDPASVPVFWISKWMDYSDKFGFGYQLCDRSVGVLFNDESRIIQTDGGETMQYAGKNCEENYYKVESYPTEMSKKVRAFEQLTESMRVLQMTGGDVSSKGDITRLPYLFKWYSTDRGMLFILSNGTLQFNFFQDHIKIIMCPLMEAITVIYNKESMRTFKIPLLQRYGCSKDMSSRINYINIFVCKLLTKN